MERAIEFGPISQTNRWIRPVPAVVAAAGPKNSFRLVILFLLILYSNIAIAYKQLDVLRPALVIAGLAIVMLALELGQIRQKPRLMWPQGMLILAVLGVCFLSSFSAFWPGFAFAKTMDFAKIVLVYILIENTVTDSKRLRTILLTMVIGGLFPAIGTISHYVFHILRDGRAAWIGVFANANEDAYGMVILIPIAIALLIDSGWLMRAALLGVIGTYLLAIFLTYSRGGLLGVLAVFGLIAWKQKSALVRSMLVIGLLGSVVFGGMYWQRQQGFNNLSGDTTVKQRLGTMKAGLQMFADHPLLGVGPACSMFAYPLYVPPEDRCGCEIQLTVHNTVVEVLSELGVLGFIPFILLMGVSLIHVRQLQKGELAPYTTALEIALWGFVVCGLSGGFAYTWWPYILSALIVSAKYISHASVEPANAKN